MPKEKSMTLTREQIEDMRECLRAFEDHYDQEHIKALCDLALRALTPTESNIEQTNAAGQADQEHGLTSIQSTPVQPDPAAPHSEPQVPGSASVGAADTGERCDSPPSAEPVDTVSRPARSEPAQDKHD